jgi:transposase
MADRLIMNKKERDRKVILEQILLGQIRKTDARKRLRISDRQLRRLISRYRQEGDEGLIHKSRGKPSTRAYPEEIKQQVLKVYRERYMNFGPTFASEKLAENEHMILHHETLRLWLKEAGLWEQRRIRKAYRKQRERRARFGELVQLDGSIHAWFTGIEKKQCLMNMVDDATGKTLALMDRGETTRAAFLLLQWWIREFGIPLAIYVDLKSLYVAPKSLRCDEDGNYVEPEWLTHFSRACDKLGIEIIKAYSPQAKGRVERNHAVYQDRLVKELKLQNITDLTKANDLLTQGFVNRLNEKFAKLPREQQDAHVPVSVNDDLDQILCWEYTRQVGNDWTVQFERQFFQIEKKAAVYPKQKVTIRKHLDDNISLWNKQVRIEFKPIQKQPGVPKEKKGYDSMKRSAHASKNRHKTPWGQFNYKVVIRRKKTNRVSAREVRNLNH